jgi:hypothetical protein
MKTKFLMLVAVATFGFGLNSCSTKTQSKAPTTEDSVTTEQTDTLGGETLPVVITE